ncbi:MAG: hypothetical protein FJ271_10825 [Planctomycetes bacterium]|nr:hypothetical protein [Planctomycetota bacterium]
MRFALLGEHPDGLDMAWALVGTGRHELAVYCGGALGMERLRRWQLSPPRVGDVEEALADPQVEAVIVAGSPADRMNQLRRALQSEHHVLCVHPLDMDGAYEAGMLQKDARRLLLPLLPEALHPAFLRLAELTDAVAGPAPTPTSSTAITESVGPASRPAAAPGAAFDRLDMELCTTETVFAGDERDAEQLDLPGWNVARMLGGEIVEVFGLTSEEEIVPGELVLVTGRFLRGGMFRAAFVPRQSESRWRWTLVKRSRRFDVIFPQGWPGPATLMWTDDALTPRHEHWDAWNPWPALVAVFEAALGRFTPESIVDTGKHRSASLIGSSEPRVLWQDEVRGLELNDAAHRSVERRRASTLDFQEASEEVGFKGAMTLVGCSLIWLSLALLIFSIWLPWLGWLIAPVFGIFLLMQLFRWAVPNSAEKVTDK